MHSDLSQHPCLKHNDVLSNLCKPLQNLGITFFGYTAVDSDNKAYCLGSKPDYAIEYLRRNHVKNDVHALGEKQKSQYEYDFWDFLNLDLQREELYRMAAAFDQGHTLTLSRHEKTITHCYHFSGHMQDQGINQRYLEKMDSIHAFVDYFNSCLTNIKEINAIYEYPINVNSDDLLRDKKLSLINSDPRLVNLSEQAHATLQFTNSSQYYLNESERDCLQWLHLGKSAAMIAEIMNVSRKTIERHFASIKKKYNCYTLYQMGEKIATTGLSRFIEHRRTN